MVGREGVGGDAGSFLILHCDQQVCMVPARDAVNVHMYLFLETRINQRGDNEGDSSLGNDNATMERHAPMAQWHESRSCGLLVPWST